MRKDRGPGFTMYTSPAMHFEEARRKDTIGEPL